MVKCECGETFNNAGALATHEKYCEKSDEEVAEEFVCECGKSFKSEGAYKTHIRSCSDDFESLQYENVECPDCGKLISKTQFDKHLSSNSCGRREKLFSVKEEWVVKDGYKCPKCGEVYSKNGMINHYYRTHTEEGRNLVSYSEGNDEKIEKVNSVKEKTGHYNQFEKARSLGKIVPNHPNKGESVHDEQSKQKLRKAALKNLEEGEFYRKTGIEEDVEEWLTKNDFTYEYGFILNEKYEYDFKVGSVLVEVHGDFWHANPLKYNRKNLYDVQLKKVKKDKEKKLFAKQNGFEYIVIWEDEVNGGDFSTLFETFAAGG